MDGEVEGKCFGGMVWIKIVVDVKCLEFVGSNYVVLDVGDLFQGLLFYIIYKGVVEVEFMEVIGYDVMVVGNYEFDDGFEGFEVFVDIVFFFVIFGNFDLILELVLNGKVFNYVVLNVGG